VSGTSPRRLDHAACLLATCAAGGPGEHPVVIGDRELTASMAAVAGAIEITVRGWDISVACGLGRHRLNQARQRPRLCLHDRDRYSGELCGETVAIMRPASSGARGRGRRGGPPDRLRAAREDLPDTL